MTRFRHIAAGFAALFFANVVAAAITLTPLAGSTPQTARPGQGLANPVGVVATDDSSAPVSGLAVTFQMPLSWIYVQPKMVGTVTVSTDANGVAVVPYPGIWAIANPGDYQAFAVATGAARATFDVSVVGPFPATALFWGGFAQAIPAGAVGQPFTVQVLDADGAPIPYPIVKFTAPTGSATDVTASFNGNAIAVIEGGADGFATSPPVLAGSVTGSTTMRVEIFETPGTIIIPGAELDYGDPFTIVTPPPPPPPLTITLTPLAGSTPQSTCKYCFFPNPVGVIARNQDGSPASGVTVTFANDPSIVQVPGHEGTTSFDVVTGADGIAIAASQSAPSGYLAFQTGSEIVTASSSVALNQVTFNLSAGGNAQNRIELLSGSGQSVQPGIQFAPLVVRASDDNGPVPNAAVQFSSSQPGGAGDSFVSFNGLSLAYVAADAQGIARSPAPVAGSIAGSPLVSAMLREDNPAPGFSGWVPGISFGLLIAPNLPSLGLLRAWQVPPLSLAAGASTVIPFAMQVLDASGNPVAHAPVTFTTDSSCGTFNGSRTVTATSDANGVATAPLFRGTRASLACATSAHAQGQSRDLTMHVFDPSKVQAAISPNFVLVHYLDAVYSLSLTFTERGRPVHVAQATISLLPHLGASLATTPIFDVFDNGSIFIGLTPNQRAGTYLVQVTTIGGQRFLVPVVQVP